MRWMIPLAGIALLALSTSHAAAQGPERADVHIRNDCRLAGQVIRTGHPAPRLTWAYSVIRQCEQTGAEALATRWETVSDTVELAELAGASAQFPTRAMFDATSMAVRLSRDTNVRVYAISVLASFADPDAALALGDLRNPRDGRRPRIMAGSGNRGERPPVAMRAEVLAVLQQVRAETADGVVRRIADEYILFLSPR